MMSPFHFICRSYRRQVAAATIIATLSLSGCATVSETMNIYFVDVEGGQATLVVSPDGETLLIDAGFPGAVNDARDARRIAAAASDAGVSQIDVLLVTHFHPDHYGGVIELSNLLPIGTFVDHGAPAPEAVVKPGRLELFEAYKELRAEGDHIIPAVGDRLPMTQIDAIVVSSDRMTLGSSLDGAGEINESCGRPFPGAEERFENPRSTGILIQLGDFRFLDIGDLAGQPLSDLVCPRNRIGLVDVYLVPHHGNADAASPATLSGLRPRVAILNNGATKGGAARMFSVLRDRPEPVETWQLHRSEAEGAENFSEERIANLDEQTAHWIKLSAKSDGSFRILNGRTGKWKDYGRDRSTN